MRISIGYSDSEDRIWLRTQRSRILWWLTRRIALRLVAQWAAMIERDPWQALAAEAGAASASAAAPGTARMLQAHARAVAATRGQHIPPVERPAPGVVLENCLLASVQLAVRQTGMAITLSAGAREESWLMSPDECHRMLDALVARCRRSGWLESELPQWLAAPEPAGAPAAPDAGAGGAAG